MQLTSVSRNAEPELLVMERRDSVRLPRNVFSVFSRIFHVDKSEFGFHSSPVVRLTRWQPTAGGKGHPDLGPSP